MLEYGQIPYQGNWTLDFQKFSLLSRLRAEGFAVRISRHEAKRDDPKEEAEDVAVDTFGVLIQTMGQCWPELVYAPNLQEWPWWETLIHRLIIAFEVQGISLKEIRRGSHTHGPLFGHTWSEVITMVKDVVRRTHPEEARRLLAFFRDDLVILKGREIWD